MQDVRIATESGGLIDISDDEGRLIIQSVGGFTHDVVQVSLTSIDAARTFRDALSAWIDERDPNCFCGSPLTDAHFHPADALVDHR